MMVARVARRQRPKPNAGNRARSAASIDRPEGRSIGCTMQKPLEAYQALLRACSSIGEPGFGSREVADTGDFVIEMLPFTTAPS